MWKTKQSSYLFKKRGVFYFSRRVPADLTRHYSTNRISISLKTKSSKIAFARAATLAAKLEQDWLTLRWNNDAAPFSRFTTDQPTAQHSNSSAPLLSEAKEIYVRAKGGNRSITFHQAADRSVS